MPKISRSGGATSAAAGREQKGDAWPSAGEPESPAEGAASGGVVENVPVVGEDGPSPAVLPEREHQLDGPTEGVEIPADGTAPPVIEGDGSGEALPLVEVGEGEESSPGSSSETSHERPPGSPVTSESDPQSRAPKTGSRSRKARTPSSTAGSAGGSTGADGS